jgi:uncharacterized protein
MPVRPIARDSLSAPFFDATAAGELLVHRCTSCGHYNEGSYELCTACRGNEFTWERSDGTGTLVSWTVMHGRPAEDGTVPKTVSALVELPEGPWIWAQIVDLADPASLTPGTKLAVDFERPEGSEAVPVFRVA